MDREYGEDVKDAIFRATGRFSPHADPGKTFNERESPARAALRAGVVVSERDAIDAAAAAVVEEIEDEASRVGRSGRPLSAAGLRLRGV